MPRKIHFHRVGDEFSEFSNFAEFPFRLSGKQWATSEHYVVSGYPAREVTWFLEPEEDRWSFHLEDGNVTVRVTSDRGVETDIGTGEPVAPGWTIWRALRHLQVDEAWQGALQRVGPHPFPHRSVARLHELLEAHSAPMLAKYRRPNV